MQTREISEVNGLCRRRGLPRFRHYSLIRGFGSLGLHLRPMSDVWSAPLPLPTIVSRFYTICLSLDCSDDVDMTDD